MVVFRLGIFISSVHWSNHSCRGNLVSADCGSNWESNEDPILSVVVACSLHLLNVLTQVLVVHNSESFSLNRYGVYV